MEEVAGEHHRGGDLGGAAHEVGERILSLPREPEADRSDPWKDTRRS